MQEIIFHVCTHLLILPSEVVVRLLRMSPLVKNDTLTIQSSFKEEFGHNQARKNICKQRHVSA